MHNAESIFSPEKVMATLHIGAVFALLMMSASCAPARVPITPTATASPLATAVASTSPTAPPTAIPTPTATPDPYDPYTIAYLRSRSYRGGALEIVSRVGANSAFTRYLVRYPSEGLTIHGFMNVPNGEGPHPVIIALHGYIDPAVYDTFDYTTHYADALASAGYLVMHPNLRGYAPSDDGDNLFRVGMALDVLNLIAIIKSTAGQPGALETADGTRIGMWGHSMGGGVTTRVITVSPDVRAAVLYAAMSGDEARNYEAIGTWSNGERGSEERAVPAEELMRISPINFLDGITAAVSIHHGLQDELVPVQWSMQTCELLKAARKTVECHYYEDMPHTFHGQGDKEFIQYTIQFMDRYLRAPEARRYRRPSLVKPQRYNRGVTFTTVFFDLDDTLYPATSGLWPTLKQRMNHYMTERLHIPAEEVPSLRERYFRQYGTTLRGLQANHVVDIEDYLAFVHDVRLEEYIHPDPVQQSVLAGLPTRNLIFTNADANHARRVLRELQIEGCFIDIIDVNRMEPYCKPSREAFAIAMQAAQESDPGRCVMIDDLPHTTRAAREFGFYSILFGAASPGEAADAACMDWPALAALVNGSRP
jgi:pyrimidine 5'-nucleotidase